MWSSTNLVTSNVDIIKFLEDLESCHQVFKNLDQLFWDLENVVMSNLMVLSSFIKFCKNVEKCQKCQKSGQKTCQKMMSFLTCFLTLFWVNFGREVKKWSTGGKKHGHDRRLD